MIDKSELLDSLRGRIAVDLAALERRQRDTQAGATHEENRAEHAKDTRATEQSYLARGLAERVEDLRRTATALATLQLRSFAPDEPIALTALVLIESQDGESGSARRESWFVVPGGGGLELAPSGADVRTVTPRSPLGRSLLGLREGDEGTLLTPRGQRRFEVLEIR